MFFKNVDTEKLIPENRNSKEHTDRDLKNANRLKASYSTERTNFTVAEKEEKGSNFYAICFIFIKKNFFS